MRSGDYYRQSAPSSHAKPVLDGQILPAFFAGLAGFKFSLTAFSGLPSACRLSHCSGTIFAVSKIAPPVLGGATKEIVMSMGSIGGSCSLSQLYAAQQAQAASAVSVVAPATGASDSTSGTDASGSNSLTGNTTASLDSQTLQALMNLTQQDPATGGSPADASSNGQTGQTQGLHHHHRHHHGGGMGQSAGSSSSLSSSTSGTTSATDVFGVASADSADDTTQASLDAALLSA
jgi:hypothetical protein